MAIAQPSFAMIVSVGFLIFTALVVILVAFSWHTDKDVRFDLREVILDSATGKIAIEKVGYMTALTVSCWGFVSLMLEGKPIETYATLFLGTFAITRIASQGLSVYKDTKTKDTP